MNDDRDLEGLNAVVADEKKEDRRGRAEEASWEPLSTSIVVTLSDASRSPLVE